VKLKGPLHDIWSICFLHYLKPTFKFFSHNLKTVSLSLLLQISIWTLTMNLPYNSLPFTKSTENNCNFNNLPLQKYILKTTSKQLLYIKSPQFNDVCSAQISVLRLFRSIRADIITGSFVYLYWIDLNWYRANLTSI